jgi:hypothetical protein
VFADFDNTGPIYSKAYVLPNTSNLTFHTIAKSFNTLSNYQKVPRMILKPKKIENPTGPVELVTVPALGPEWQRDELRDMTKSGRREKKSESRKKKRGLCGKQRFLVYLKFCKFAFTLTPRIYPSHPRPHPQPEKLSRHCQWFLQQVHTFRVLQIPCQLLLPSLITARIRYHGKLLPSHFQPHRCASIQPQFRQVDWRRVYRKGDNSSKSFLSPRDVPQL